MATEGEREFAPGFVLRVEGVLEVYDKQAATPEAALPALLRSERAYLAPKGTTVRVFRIVDLGDPAATELYGERIEQDPLVSPETVYRRIYNSSLVAMIDFVFDLAPGEVPPGYEELLAELQGLDPRVRSIHLVRVAMTDDVHICDEECRFFGKPDHLARLEASGG